MGFKERFLAATGKQDRLNSSVIKNDRDFARSISESDFLPIVRESEIDLKRYSIVPISDVQNSNDSLLPIIQLLALATKTDAVPNIKEKLYRRIDPKGVIGKMMNSKTGLGELGNIMRINDQGKNVVAARAIYQPVNGLALMPNMLAQINPATLLAAALVFVVIKKFDDIKNTQVEILQYLRQKDVAALKGNLTILIEIFDSYKYQWSNDAYISAKRIQIQSIKQASEASVNQCHDQVYTELNKLSGFHMFTDIACIVQDVHSRIKEYQIALYSLALSDFLDILLSFNFEQNYLTALSNKINSYISMFENTINDSNLRIKEYSESDGLSQLIGAANDVGLWFTGLFNKQQNSLSVNQEPDFFNSIDVGCISQFATSLNAINRIHNHPYGLLADNKNFYVLNE